MSEIRSQATPARDELAAYLDRVIDNEAWANTGAEAAKHIEEVLGWSKPRTVNDAAELDALPDLSVVIDKHDDVSQKRGGQWCGYETADCPSQRIAKYGPLTVLFTPGDT